MSKAPNSRLERRTPLRRKKPIWMRSKNTPGTGEHFKHDRGRVQLKRTPLRKVSKSRARQMTEYHRVRREFLGRQENRYCLICICVSIDAKASEVREMMSRGIAASGKWLLLCGARLSGATEVHHFAGRRHRLLSHVPYFVPSCFQCREWPHANTVRARELGLLSSATLWEVFPKTSS